MPGHIVIDDVLSADACAARRAHAATLDFQLASIAYPSGTRVATDVRNNARAIEHDPSLADRLFQLLRPHLPARVHGRDLVGLSPRIRYYRYQPGERFAPHRDGVEA
ncbi:MAG TPA: hypothetical protein VL400_25425, partial [Polyangiaceae bacterium]|nr:hypothetical protein [Polyangiaceae bacterium]